MWDIDVFQLRTRASHARFYLGSKSPIFLHSCEGVGGLGRRVCISITLLPDTVFNSSTDMYMYKE